MNETMLEGRYSAEDISVRLEQAVTLLFFVTSKMLDECPPTDKHEALEDFVFVERMPIFGDSLSTAVRSVDVLSKELNEAVSKLYDRSGD